MLAGNSSLLFAPRPSTGNDSFTKLLVHADGEVGPWYFYDGSLTSHGYASTSGNPLSNNSTGLFGSNASLNLDGSSFIYWGDNADWDFGGGSFTIDWWEYRSATAPTAGRPVINRANVVYSPWLLGYNAGSIMQVYMSSNNTSWDIANGRSLGAPVYNAWTHYAVVRSGNNFYAFQNGTMTDSWSSTLSFWTPTGHPVYVGYWNTNYYIGYIEELRISKGIARWTSNFTPSSVPYAPPQTGQPAPPQTPTRILLHFDSNIVDAASNIKGNAAHTWSSDYGMSYVPGKFGSSKEANAIAHASAYADFQMGSGDFTMDMWLHTDKGNSGATEYEQYIAAHANDNTYQFMWLLSLTSSGYIHFQATSNGSQATGLICEMTSSATLGDGTNDWTHVAIVRTGSTWLLFLKGILRASYSNGAAMGFTSWPITIGNYTTYGTADAYLNSIDEFRLTKRAIWTTTFTPPAGPGSVE